MTKVLDLRVWVVWLLALALLAVPVLADDGDDDNSPGNGKSPVSFTVDHEFDEPHGATTLHKVDIKMCNGKSKGRSSECITVDPVRIAGGR
ncbi:MAG: hypothetical protein ACE5JP_09480 [Candidatus Bipolaricaulia bacterium]